eukprot:5337781-Pyramimonas_sp.AAC.1
MGRGGRKQLQWVNKLLATVEDEEEDEPEDEDGAAEGGEQTGDAEEGDEPEDDDGSAARKRPAAAAWDDDSDEEPVSKKPAMSPVTIGKPAMKVRMTLKRPAAESTDAASDEGSTTGTTEEKNITHITINEKKSPKAVKAGVPQSPSKVAAATPPATIQPKASISNAIPIGFMERRYSMPPVPPPETEKPKAMPPVPEIEKPKAVPTKEGCSHVPETEKPKAAPKPSETPKAKMPTPPTATENPED